MMPVASTEIVLVSLQFDHDLLMEEMHHAIQGETGIRTRIDECHHDIAPFYDAGRSQYNADLLLKHLDDYYPRDETRVVGITGVDLFTPILSFLFGQAYLGGKSAIVSGFRLKNERYGLPPDEELFQQRLLKGVMHELGHSFGLKHCVNPDCVMVASTYVEDVDHKNSHYCSRCRATLVDLDCIPGHGRE